jgi:2-keto-3-deoxy-L-rhamnonate aldolase RhmA
MRANPLKQALKAGETVFGSQISLFRSPEVARIYAMAGFDFVFIDMEHSPFALETVSDMIAAARSANIVPVVRVPQGEYPFVCRVLDQGAQGVIVPRVNSPKEVSEIVSWMRYPPEGIRGFAATTAQTDHEEVATRDFIDANNHETLCVIQIERREALDDLDEMLSFPSVDVACLGYMDLSIDLGFPGQLDHPQMVAIIERIIAVAKRHGVAAGIIGPQIEPLVHWMQKGMRFISYSTESRLLQEAATSAVRRLRSAKGNAGLRSKLSVP